MWQMSLHSWNFRPHVCDVTAVALLLTEQWSICRDVSDWSVVRSITLLKVSTRREMSSFYALHPNWFIRRGNRFIVISYCTGRNKNSTNQLNSCTPPIKWSYFYSHNIISDQFQIMERTFLHFIGTKIAPLILYFVYKKKSKTNYHLITI